MVKENGKINNLDLRKREKSIVLLEVTAIFGEKLDLGFHEICI